MNQEHFTQARQCLQTGDNETAQEQFMLAVTENQKDTESWVGLGQARARLGQVDAALHAFKTALQLDPENHAANFGVSWAHFEQREWTQAEIYARKAANLAPEIANYHEIVAACAIRRNDMEITLQAFEAIQRIDPTRLDKRARWVLLYCKIFAGVEKLSLLVVWALFATLLFVGLANRWLWAIFASLPFMLVSIYNFMHHQRRRGIWAIILWLAWLVGIYLLARLWITWSGI